MLRCERAGDDGRDEGVPERELHGGGGQGHVVPLADGLDAAGLFEDFGRGGVIGVAGTFDRAGGEDAGSENRADDDAHVALLAEREFLVEGILIQ